MTTVIDAVDLGPFEFESGVSIPNLRIAYETYGTFTGENAVLVCHALTGSSHAGIRQDPEKRVELPPMGGQAHAWWSDIIGPGKPIDTTEYYVIVPNLPGSCYGSTGPASEHPETGEPYGSQFPPVTIGDWTRAQRRLLDTLGVGRLHAVVGGSVGGMNVLEWLVRYPDDLRYAIPIATAPRVDAQLLAINAIARRAIMSDPNWRGGEYYGQTPPTTGLAIARQLGHVTYLSKAAMNQRFGRRSASHDGVDPVVERDQGATYFPYRDVESYLDYNARQFVDRFDPNSYLYLTRAMDNYGLAAGYESDRAAVAAFSGEVLLLSITGDWHFTVEQAAGLAEAVRTTDAEIAHHVIDSSYGHDAFLTAPEKIGPPIADFLTAGTAGNAVTDTTECPAREEPSEVPGPS